MHACMRVAGRQAGRLQAGTRARIPTGVSVSDSPGRCWQVVAPAPAQTRALGQVPPVRLPPVAPALGPLPALVAWLRRLRQPQPPGAPARGLASGHQKQPRCRRRSRCCHRGRCMCAGPARRRWRRHPRLAAAPGTPPWCMMPPPALPGRPPHTRAWPRARPRAAAAAALPRPAARRRVPPRGAAAATAGGARSATLQGPAAPAAGHGGGHVGAGGRAARRAAAAAGLLRLPPVRRLPGRAPPLQTCTWES